MPEEQYIIGTIVGVTGDQVLVELVDHKVDGEVQIGVPENMSISVTHEKEKVPLLIGQPGTFISIAIPNGVLLSIVTDIQMKEGKLSTSEVKTAEATELYPLNSPARYLNVLPIGTISTSGEFERGTDVFPTVNSSAFAVLPSTINKIYESFAEGIFSIGTLSLLPSQEAKINLDSFLSRHAAILGQTGGGKSWTVASILQEIAKFPQSTVVLLDLHGEYKTAFKDEDVDYVDVKELEFPYWLMNSEEIIELMVDRAESAAPNQIAKFKELLQASKESHPENTKLSIPKITIDTPVYFDFGAIIAEFRSLDVGTKIGASGKSIKGDFNGQFTRLLMRIDSRLNDKRYDLIFKPKKYNTSASMKDLFIKLLGEGTSPKKITVFDLSSIPFDVRNSMISLMMRCLFDFSYWYRKVNSKAYPISLFCDEAHIYLNEKESSTTASKMSAERIAKEGRKYGVSLTVISQRPREVSSTILSQCNTFLCLRISNPDDQSYVKSLLPDSMRGIVNMFSSLRRGEGILLGDSVIMPTRIKIRRPDPTPDSNDISFYKQWNEAHQEIDISRVLDSWRKQE